MATDRSGLASTVEARGLVPGAHRAVAGRAVPHLHDPVHPGHLRPGTALHPRGPTPLYPVAVHWGVFAAPSPRATSARKLIVQRWSSPSSSSSPRCSPRSSPPTRSRSCGSRSSACCSSSSWPRCCCRSRSRSSPTSQTMRDSSWINSLPGLHVSVPGHGARHLPHPPGLPRHPRDLRDAARLDGFGHLAVPAARGRARHPTGHRVVHRHLLPRRVEPVPVAPSRRTTGGSQTARSRCATFSQPRREPNLGFAGAHHRRDAVWPCSSSSNASWSVASPPAR